jgi:hypothetical protein
MSARSVDEVALMRDTINQYGPTFIAPLSIEVRRPGIQKNSSCEGMHSVRAALSVREEIEVPSGSS